MRLSWEASAISQSRMGAMNAQRSTSNAQPSAGHSVESWKLVRFVKSCASEGESPSSLAAEPLEFRTNVMNGKV